MYKFDKNITKTDRKASAIMLQGTGSDVGKSLLAAGLCRLFSGMGLRVSPFKPQNMTNNAAITVDGGEIGGAQALQSMACGLKPTSDMNPVLLKPRSDRGSEVIVQGRSRGVMTARNYMEYRSSLMPEVLESFSRLRDRSDIVIVEGAGSIAEVNLRDGDIANMGFAMAANVPVLLVADIDRGGAIASIVGSHILLKDEERALLKGYVVNKFRGDVALFTPATDTIREHTSMPCFGVVPWFESASKLPAEDSLALSLRCAASDSLGEKKEPYRAGKIRICVLRLPRVSNFDEFDPLALDESVKLSFLEPGSSIPGDADLVVIPDTESVISDLEFVKRVGWDIDIAAHVRRGGRVFGVCGGYYMLGRSIMGLANSDSGAVVHEGLSQLDVVTELTEERGVRQISSETECGLPIYAIEIKNGLVTGPDAANPLFILGGVPMGAVSRSGGVSGCCISGLFANDAFRAHFLSGFSDGTNSFNYKAVIDSALDELAAHVGRYLDIAAMERVLNIKL